MSSKGRQGAALKIGTGESQLLDVLRRVGWRAFRSSHDGRPERGHWVTCDRWPRCSDYGPTSE
jgi:hypothetical protein